ncbi:MAG: hypothetical protein JXR52_04155 [Bacteroidales bacterium]|nr:hypothetical protein [Bacteroidales bacterium]
MKNRFVYPILVIALAAAGCEKDQNEPLITGNVVIIEDDITEPSTWYADSVYLIKAYDFYVENTLTIQPGTVIKFHPSDGPYMVLSGSGTIVANGSASLPIVFTSFKDDEHGGDTNGDKSVTAPAKKDWGYISTNGANGSSFKYCHFYYGGKFSYSYTLGIESGSVATVMNCTFAHNAGDDASGWYGALDCSSADKATQVKNNIFYDNVRPLSIMADMNMDDSNIFHDPEHPEVINSYNGIFVETINDVTAATVMWGETEVAFVIDDNDWWIVSGASLRLADNVVLKFRPDGALCLSDGAAALINHDGAGVYFTSYKDDTKKGDTNGDGISSTPNTGDWYGIWDDNAIIMLNWPNILYDEY